MRVCLPERKDESASSEKMDRNEWEKTVVNYIKVTNIEAGLNGLNRERMARSEHGRVVVSSKK